VSSGNARERVPINAKTGTPTNSMIKVIIIPFHSLVELITNSSSETYISSDANTIKALKALVDNILELAGSTQKFDDLFTADITFEYEGEIKGRKGWSHNLTEDELRQLEAFGLIAEGATDRTIDPCKEVFQNSLRVLPKVDNELTRKIAQRLNNITGMFNMTSAFNG